MNADFKFRLVANRVAKKNIMSPEFRCILDLEKDVTLSGTIEVLGTKELNGNIQVQFRQFFESQEEKAIRIKKYQKRP